MPVNLKIQKRLKLVNYCMRNVFKSENYDMKNDAIKIILIPLKIVRYFMI